ncbi:MAG TPA: flagellar hook-basal body complex protein [Alphaproteobacteria bacterium]|nr:flagellar hook-basal body complex protein [Alphaproteobacteria bacterium]
MSSLLGSFNLGVNALVASSSAFATISQNMANSRTPGYRRVETEFATLLGGIDVRGSQPGGVRAYTRTNMDVQGSLEITNRKFDIAIDGPGMFVFGQFEGGSDADEFRYSRDGSLTSIRSPDVNDPVGYLGNETGLYLLGWELENGEVVSDSLADLRPLPATTNDAFEGQQTANADLIATLPANQTTAATQIFYFDANGARQTLMLNWTKNAPNSWTLQPTDPAGNPVGGPIPMTFDGTGNITSATSITIAGFNLNVSQVNQVGNFFQLGQYIQDGVARGEFVAYEILPDGRVNARYTNGAVRSLYKVPVATFPNQAGLIEESGTMYRVSDKSGDPTLNEVGEQSIQIVAGAVEMANFDLSQGFTQLIITQRAYDTAAQVVRTVDEMSQVVTQLL